MSVFTTSNEITCIALIFSILYTEFNLFSITIKPKGSCFCRRSKQMISTFLSMNIILPHHHRSHPNHIQSYCSL